MPRLNVAFFHEFLFFSLHFLDYVLWNASPPDFNALSHCVEQVVIVSCTEVVELLDQVGLRLMKEDFSGRKVISELSYTLHFQFVLGWLVGIDEETLIAYLHLPFEPMLIERAKYNFLYGDDARIPLLYELEQSVDKLRRVHRFLNCFEDILPVPVITACDNDSRR